MTIGEKIKKIRTSKGLTQKQLGDLCGMADSAIRRYELDKANPKIETIQKIAEALSVDYSYFLSNKSYKITKELIMDYPAFTDSLLYNLYGKIKPEYYDELLGEHSIDKFITQLNHIIDTVVLDDNYEIIQIYYKDTYESTMSDLLKKLNERGKKEAIKRVEELTEIKKYTVPDTDS